MPVESHVLMDGALHVYRREGIRPCNLAPRGRHAAADFEDRQSQGLDRGDSGYADTLKEVRGKRGVGFCKSMPGAIMPFERIRKRKGLKPTGRVFGKSPREL